jgi:ribonuclease R
MLPESLSTGLCSLLPGEDRLTISAFLDLDAKGKVVHTRFAETVIRSRFRLTYGEAAGILGSKSSPDQAPGAETAGDQDLRRMLREAERAMQLMQQRRQRQGSLDFDIPDGKIVLDGDLKVKGIHPVERTVAHRIIEDFMIAANEAAARELERHEIPTLHRVHEPPRAASLEKLKSLLQPFGIGLPDDLSDLSRLDPVNLRKTLLSVAGRPEEGLVATLILRSLSRALYEPKSKGHFALSKRFYTHFTSPIRRYPDLLVHRQLKSLLRNESDDEIPSELLEERETLPARLPGIGRHCSTTERRAERAERELKQWKMVRFLANRVGEEFAGEIIGVHRSGLFVFLKEYFVDGFVPVRSLGADEYRFDELLQSLVGERTEKTYRLGDELKVYLVELNERRRSLDLGLADAPPAKRRDSGGSRASRARRRRSGRRVRRG